MKYYMVDAFADRVFAGNPAGVCVLEEALDEGIMQQIAAENNLSETAFVSRAEDGFDLRWFTPKAEIDLCGHATLGAAYVAANFIDRGCIEMVFHTVSGELRVMREEERYILDFPSRMPEMIESTDKINSVFDKNISEVYLSRDLVVVLENEQAVQSFVPDYDRIMAIEEGLGLIITAPGDEVDFVSRCFYPRIGILEDPVTGSAHSNLIPLWSKKLHKKRLEAVQVSPRRGHLHCEAQGERVLIGGTAALYMTGEIFAGE